MNLEDIVKQLETELVFHKQEVSRIEAELGILKKYLPTKFIKSNFNTEVVLSMNTKFSFKKAILSFLSDGIPKKARELFEEYKKCKGDNDYKYSSFSPQLSILKEIKKHEFNDKSQEDRFYYGLNEWFDGDKLKEEYIVKIN